MSDAAPYAVAVDDDALILMHVTEILEEAGFLALTSETVAGALLLLAQHGDRVTLLFTDVELSDALDGFALARMAAERWPEIGILVASGRQRPQDGDLPDGALFVSKPFSADVVHERLQELLPDDRKPEPLKRGI